VKIYASGEMGYLKFYGVGAVKGRVNMSVS
jgi:hypothetical protein